MIARSVLAGLLVFVLVAVAALSLSADEKRRFLRYRDYQSLGDHVSAIMVIKDDLDGRCWAILGSGPADTGTRTAFGPVPCGDASNNTK